MTDNQKPDQATRPVFPQWVPPKDFVAKMDAASEDDAWKGLADRVRWRSAKTCTEGVSGPS